MVGEEGCDGPGGAQHGDDEEYEDIVGREGIGFRVDMDEVGEHAKGWDLREKKLVGDRRGVIVDCADGRGWETALGAILPVTNN